MRVFLALNFYYLIIFRGLKLELEIFPAATDSRFLREVNFGSTFLVISLAS